MEKGVYCFLDVAPVIASNSFTIVELRKLVYDCLKINMKSTFVGVYY